MVDRRINFGDPADSGTRWQIEDDANAAGGGNFVLAKDLDGNTVLLQYNPTSDAFEFVRAVDMGGEDVTGVGGVVGESGAGVYDDATQTVGDGTTSADHESVSTGDLDGEYPGKVRGIANGQVITTVDPATTTTPVQDTVDAVIANGGGTVFLPPNTIDESGSVSGIGSSVRLIGHGTDVSAIRFTDTSSDGLIIDSNQSGTPGHMSNIDGVFLVGDDQTTRASNSTAAMRFNASLRSFNMGNVRFNGWGDCIVFDQGAPHTCYWNHLDFGFSSNSGKNIDIQTAGPPISIGSMACGNGQSSVPALDLAGAALEMTIGSINMGGFGKLMNVGGPPTHLVVGHIAYEPAQDPSGGYVGTLSGAGCHARLLNLEIKGSVTLDAAWELDGTGAAHIGEPRTQGTVSFNKSPLDVTADLPSRRTFYYGSGSDVTDSTGGSTFSSVQALDTAGTSAP